MSKLRQYKWRLYADNNIEREIVDHLRYSDIDVLWIAENPELRRQQDDTFHYRHATQLGRYLLTKDLDFWNDRKHPLSGSLGVIVIATDDVEAAKYLPILLRKLISDYNPTSEPLYLDGIKVKLNTDGIAIRMVDHDTQTVTNESWKWTDLI